MSNRPYFYGFPPILPILPISPIPPIPPILPVPPILHPLKYSIEEKNFGGTRLTTLTPPVVTYRMPAEWEPHQACWLAFPSHEDLWMESLEAARGEFVDLCRAIADPDPISGECRGDSLEILCSMKPEKPSPKLP